MTDNRTTELREKLTEHGVDYEVKDLPNVRFFHDTRWNANGVRWCYTEFVGATTCLTMCNDWKDCTPEQAIATTLGSDREKALEELVRDAYWLIVRAVWTHVSQDKFAADWTERMSVLGIEVD